MKDDIQKIKKYVRAANYLTVTQIYLQDNFLLKRPLEAIDIKPKLFGHWGTCPGINFVYANLNYIAKKQKQETIFVLGPGHGFPALQANLFLERTLEKFYPQITHTSSGIEYMSRQFSWPYGFSSHSNPEAPGLILEGGELGYSLATAYGAILDNPDLLAVCMIGDGEAETGPIAAAWHINKLIDPAKNGMVLPVLHVNGYKISGPTIFGRMSKKELTDLFNGYGYEPFFVKDGATIYEDMLSALQQSLKKIRRIQQKAKKNKKPFRSRFPMIILQTPKGWTGIKELDSKKIEGSILAHQVVAPNAKKSSIELAAIEDWLKSYQFKNLFSEQRGFIKDILDIIPAGKYIIGQNQAVYSNHSYRPLIAPRIEKLVKQIKKRGEISSNSMAIAGKYLAEVFRLNSRAKNFRLMSPDETYSNRLQDVFTQTSRAFAWPHHLQDLDLSKDGRVMEMLSEHNLHGLAQGYILTGRHSVFTTYEAFATIFASMAHQYEKFLKIAREISWRGMISSMNYLLSSVLWRQEHNGFTHQNPSFISSMLEKQDCNIHVYFPVDQNSMLPVLEKTLQSTNSINIVVAGKTIEPAWLSLQEARKAVKNGALEWDFISDSNPDIVFVGIGDYLTKEVVAAVEILKKEMPTLKIRVVNILTISGKCFHKDASHAQMNTDFFTKDKPVIINFHGYPDTLKSILFGEQNPKRFYINGYVEQGGTTTPFDMHIRNRTSRYNLVVQAVSILSANGLLNRQKASKIEQKFIKKINEHVAYVKSYGMDPSEIEDWQWNNLPSNHYEKDQIAILRKTKTIGIIGLSDKPERHSYQVASYLQSRGYVIVPVNPNASEVLGKKSYPNLLAVPKDQHLDIVTIYRNSEELLPHVEEVVKRGGIKTIWLPEGVRNTRAEAYALKKGITTISDCCIMKVHHRMEAL